MIKNEAELYQPFRFPNSRGHQEADHRRTQAASDSASALAKRLAHQRVRRQDHQDLAFQERRTGAHIQGAPQSGHLPCRALLRPDGQRIGRQMPARVEPWPREKCEEAGGPQENDHVAAGIEQRLFAFLLDRWRHHAVEPFGRGQPDVHVQHVRRF